MSDPGNILSTRDLFEAVTRIEAKIDMRMTALDTKVDALASRQDRLEGRFDAFGSMAKWLGPTGIALVIAAYLVQAGIVKL